MVFKGTVLSTLSDVDGVAAQLAEARHTTLTAEKSDVWSLTADKLVTKRSDDLQRNAVGSISTQVAAGLLQEV